MFEITIEIQGYYGINTNEIAKIGRFKALAMEYSTDYYRGSRP